MAPHAQNRARNAKRLFPLVAKRIDSLPAPPSALVRVIEKLARPSLTSLEVAEIVRMEPSVAAKVLRVINSPFYGLERRVSTVSHAVAMLSPAAVRRIAGGITALPGDAAGDGDLSRLRGYRHSVAVGAAAGALAEAVSFDLPEEAWVAGLLHDLGRGVLDTFAPSDYLSEIRDSGCVGRDALDLERRLLGMDHCQVGALVAEQWNFPRILMDAIGFHHEDEERLRLLDPRHRTLVSIVAAADHVCAARGLACFPGVDASEVSNVLLDGRPLDDELVSVAANGAEAALERLGEVLGCPHDLVDELRGGAEAAREALRARRRERPLYDRLKTVGEVLRQLRHSTSSDEFLSRAVRLVQQELGFDRVLYLQVLAEQERLVGRFLSDDTQLETDPGAIVLELEFDGLLGASIRDGTPVRVDNWTTDGGLLSVLGHPEAAVAAVSSGRKVIGVLCADHSHGNREISDPDVAVLGLVATDLGLLVECHGLETQVARLRSLAAKDELTGVNNRRNLMDLLQKEIDRAKRYRAPLSLVMVDIDHFKRFNDTCGHLAGDAALAEVAQLIVSSSREVDVIGRYGGEEFLVVLPETSVDQGIVYAERLRKVVDDLGERRAKDSDSIPLTISVGVTAYRAESDDLERLLRRVDHALYAAKDRGRNRVCVG